MRGRRFAEVDSAGSSTGRASSGGPRRRSINSPGSQQEFGAARAPERRVSLCKGFVNQQAAGRHGGQ